MFKELFGGNANLCVEAVEAGPQFYGNVADFFVVVWEYGVSVSLVYGFVHFVWGSGVFVSTANTGVKIKGIVFEKCPKQASANAAPKVVFIV